MSITSSMTLLDICQVYLPGLVALELKEINWSVLFISRYS